MTLTITAFFAGLALLPAASGAGQRLLRQPDISASHIVFVYAGDLWTAARTGGAATRLTRTPEVESFPRFSPDGRWIAFSRSGDVFVVPAAGGEERRLTWHPQYDRPAGWTPDGRNVLIHSERWRGTLTLSPHLFQVPIAGGPAEPLPVPRAMHGAYSPDGRRIAYGPNVEMVLWQLWKGYRGGSLGYLAIFDPAANRCEELPRGDANDVYPMWGADGIYFASDRGGMMNLYRYDTHTKKTEQLTAHAEWDVKYPNLGPGAIVYENGGWLCTLDLKTQASRQLVVELPDDVKPSAEDFARWMQALDDVWREYQNHAFRPARSWARQKERYAEWMRAAAHASDAEYVLREMLAEAGQSHVVLTPPPPLSHTTGLAGVDFGTQGHRYVLRKIYRGDEKAEKQRGPLAGTDAAEGDVLLSVNGKAVDTSRDIYAWFDGLSGKTATLTLSRAGGATSREVIVKLLADERGLRYHEWVRSSRQRVSEATGGRVGYVHVPNVETPGVEAFQSQWKAQRAQVAAMIIDARNNSGGTKPKEVFDWIANRPRWLMYGNKGVIPPSVGPWLDGPKVMIANDQAGSGGDQLPMLMQQNKIGPVVGTRTVGAMIGAGGSYKITGGWTLTVPEYGFYMTEYGAWSPENRGVEPDYRVEMRADLMAAGADPQLEKAISLALEALKTYQKMPEPPPYVPVR
jgi:C-terminal processing protease CtpA/Prc